MKSRNMIAKVVFSFMLLLVAVQAQEPFPSDFSSSDSIQTSPFSLSESVNDSEDTNVSTETPLSESVNDSEDTNVSTETQQWPLETDSDSEILSPPQSPVTLPSETPDPWETPLPTKIPSPPKHPRIPENTCMTKCDTKCLRKKVPILNNLCNKACKKNCTLLHLQVIYDCTNHCAQSMPKNFKSDENKAEGYVIDCYRKCIKKF